jgi:hypothetical protein
MRAIFFRLTVLGLAWLMLGGFRMAAVEEQAQQHLLYDVRGAFVSAHVDISRRLVADIDRLVDDSIRATFRQTAMPRAVLTIRIIDAGRLPLFVGARYRAKVTVEATAVGNGERIAVGSFAVTAFAFDADAGDALLAARVATRIAREFSLEDNAISTLATALFP